MSNRFTMYASSLVGQELIAALDRPERAFEFRLLSSLGKPAVQAVAADVAPIIARLPTKAARDAACQFCGWYVGQIMRASGYEIVQERGRVSDAPFKTGAVWQPSKRKVKIVERPPPVNPAGRLELGVSRDNDGNVVGRWLVTMSAHGLAHRIHQIGCLNKPVDQAYRDAVEYAERMNIPVLWINDRERLFPRHKRLLVEHEPSQDERGDEPGSA